MFRDINWILLAFVLCFVEHVGGFVQVPASAVLSSSSSIRDVISNLRDASATGNPARSSRISLRSSVSQGSAEWKQAGPDSPKPVYDDSGWFDRTALGIFRGAMVKSLGEDVPTEGYAGLMELALKLNQKFTAEETRTRTRTILVSLFPVFIIKLFPLMFAGPFPAFSAKLNSVITAATSKWLMGPNELFDVDPAELEAGWGDGKLQGLKIERCRFLEESGCASVCINTCKVPTQEFFIRDMGIPLTMEPDYASFECNFKFGKTPLPQQLDDVFSTPCFAQCPSKGSLRLGHAGGGGGGGGGGGAVLEGGGGGGREGGREAVSREEFEALCDSLAVQEEYDAAVPSQESFMSNLKRWVRREGAEK